MSLDERIPAMSDKELATLRENVVRQTEIGNVPRKAEAERLMPLIDAELAERRSRAPAPKAPVFRKKVAVKKKVVT
jgi:hypothetical protein